MADLKISKPMDGSLQVSNVGAEGGRGQPRREQPPERERREPRPGSEELAVALAVGDTMAMEAHYEQDADGNPMIRIIDRESGETVALLTPDELRTLTEQTGLPPGLLVHRST